MSELQTNASLTDEAIYWIRSFKKGDSRPYHEQVETLQGTTSSTGKAVFKISHYELPDKLAILLVNNGAEFMEYVRDAVVAIHRDFNDEFAKWLKSNLEIEIYDLPPVKRLDRKMRGKFVALGPCQVHRIEPQRNVKTEVRFLCSNCGSTTAGVKGKGTYYPPKKCSACSETVLTEDDDPDLLQDQRYVEVVMVSEKGISDDKSLKYWVDIRGEKAFRVPDFGETWVVSGFVKLTEDREKGPITENITHFLYLEVNSIQNVATVDQNKVDVTPDLMASRKKWVAKCIKDSKDIEQELVGKLAPWIVGEDLLKKSLLRQAVSGCVTNMAERSSIHILVMRNPGKAKTKLAMAMAALTGGGYFTGKGVSSVGLVVGLDTDPRTKQKVAKAGVAIIFNGLPKYYDEVDKTDYKEEVLAELNTPMEEEFYQETKILNRRFETKGPWCLLGNFRNRKYYPKASLSWNINLPSDLLDRFDMWHVEPTSTYDKDLEDDILDAQSDKFEKGEEIIQVDQELREHIACARSITAVTFEPGVRDVFKTFYHEMKKLEQHLDSGTMFEKRQFNGLWRQAVVRALLHLRSIVTKEDAESAVKHLTAVIAKVGIDPSTGTVDLGILTGDQKSKQNRLRIFKPVMAQAQGSRHDDVSEDIIIKSLMSGPFKTEKEAQDVFNEARESGMIFQQRPGFWKLA